MKMDNKDLKAASQEEFEQDNNQGVPFRELINSSSRITKLREKSFTYPPTICIERARIVTKFYADDGNKSLPLILKRARAFREILNQLTISVNEDELLVGSLASKPKSYPVIPESLGAIIANELDDITSREYDRLNISDADKKELIEEILPQWKGQSNFERLAPALMSFEKNLLFQGPEDAPKGTGIITANAMSFGNGGHTTLNYAHLFKVGFQGVKKDAVSHLEALDHMNAEDVDKIDFYRAVIECCEGMSEFGLRFSKQAQEQAAAESDPTRREELVEISRICARVPAHPARNFREAIQSLWFAYIGIIQEDYNRCCPVGRLDSYLYPF